MIITRKQDKNAGNVLILLECFLFFNESDELFHILECYHSQDKDRQKQINMPKDAIVNMELEQRKADILTSTYET